MELPIVTSNVTFATDAFKHVVSCFHELQTVLGHANILPNDFAVEVGFIQELKNSQGVFLFCDAKLEANIAESLVDIFRPFPYILLPLPKDLPGGDEMTIDSSSPNDSGGYQDKGKQRTVSSAQGGGGEGSGGSGEGSGGGGEAQ
jgi:uncharacterized membrane protein YgcG